MDRGADVCRLLPAQLLAVVAYNGHMTATSALVLHTLLVAGFAAVLFFSWSVCVSTSLGCHISATDKMLQYIALQINHCKHRSSGKWPLCCWFQLQLTGHLPIDICRVEQVPAQELHSHICLLVSLGSCAVVFNTAVSDSAALLTHQGHLLAASWTTLQQPIQKHVLTGAALH
jgi:hypothetical protein